MRKKQEDKLRDIPWLNTQLLKLQLQEMFDNQKRHDTFWDLGGQEVKKRPEDDDRQKRRGRMKNDLSLRSRVALFIICVLW